MKVLVCDDQPDRCEEIIARICEAGQSKPDRLVGEDLTRELKQLFENVTACMNAPGTFKRSKKLKFDDADIVIIDNNLAHLDLAGTRLTAESIAGYIRTFTATPYIISLNKNPDVDFDLRYLVGDYSTRADLALNTDHLANPALWTGDQANAKDGFLPWYWSRLNTAAGRRLEQIEFIRRHFDDAIVATFGFDDDAINFLSLHARGALSPEAEFKDVTFRDVFLTKDRSLPAQEDRTNLSGAADAHGNDHVYGIMARAVAADIDLWFRRDVVGPQECLVDVPHLLMRFPFLLGSGAADLGEWDKAVRASAAPFGLEKKLFDEHLADTVFEHDIWIPAPCFWWSKLKVDEKLNELFFKAGQENWADVVFCEDLSKFLQRLPTNDTTSPIEFPAEFEGSWGRRYIAQVDGVQYAPRSRLAM